MKATMSYFKINYTVSSKVTDLEHPQRFYEYIVVDLLELSMILYTVYILFAGYSET